MLDIVLNCTAPPSVNHWIAAAMSLPFDGRSNVFIHPLSASNPDASGCSSRFPPIARNKNWSTHPGVSARLVPYGFVTLVPRVIVYAVAQLFTLRM